MHNRIQGISNPHSGGSYLHDASSAGRPSPGIWFQEQKVDMHVTRKKREEGQQVEWIDMYIYMLYIP